GGPLGPAAAGRERRGGWLPGRGARAAGPASSAGRSLSAALRSKAGMTTAAIMGTYVLHERLFPCQAATAAHTGKMAAQQTGFFHHRGRRIAYASVGEGPPLVLPAWWARTS